MVLIHKRNNIKKDKTNKFITGQSRYCQNCGKESHWLFEVTHSTQKISQLKYCQTCKEEYLKKPNKVLVNAKLK